MTKGGDGGNTRLCFSEDRKREYYKRIHSKLRGQKRTEEQKRRMSLSNGMRGKHHTEESKNKNRLSHLGKPNPKIGETMRLREISKGKNNPMYGVDRSNDKNSMYGKKHTEESKMKKISS